MFGKVMDAIRATFLNYEICAMFTAYWNAIACHGFGMILTWGLLQPGSLLMRSKLAISALVVTSLFGSTLIASAQNQPAPGASSEGDVGSGVTSGKKTKHEKGMTTGSSTRSRANKGNAANPSDQDNDGSGANTMAAPKR
jgi:hypothetical protein